MAIELRDYQIESMFQNAGFRILKKGYAKVPSTNPMALLFGKENETTTITTFYLEKLPPKPVYDKPPVDRIEGFKRKYGQR